VTISFLKKYSWLKTWSLMTCFLISHLVAGEASPTNDLAVTIDGDNSIHLNELAIGTLLLNDVATTPKLINRVLTFEQCQAACYGGNVSGTITVDLTDKKNITHVVATVVDVDLGALLAGLGSTNDRYSGRLSGDLDITFPTSDVRKAVGRGHLTINSGNLLEMSFLANILVGNVTNVRNQDSAEVSFELRRPDFNAAVDGNVAQQDSLIHLVFAKVTMPQDQGLVLFSGDVTMDGGLTLMVIPKIGGGFLSKIPLVGQWFGSALAIASSRVARAVVRGTISKPVVVINPFASE
jgi:AsmA-like C-terminal region